MHFPPHDERALSTATRRLAAALAAVVLVCIGPAVVEVNLVAAPNSARGLLLGGGLLLVYIAWLALVPCRETLWAVTWALAIAAAGSVLTLAVVLFASPSRLQRFGLGESRTFTAAWFAVTAGLLAAASVFAGRVASRAEKPASRS